LTDRTVRDRLRQRVNLAGAVASLKRGEHRPDEGADEPIRLEREVAQ
jgi:hypothetical protein